MRRRKSTIFFLVLGISLISLAVALQVGWILLNLKQIAILVLGIVFFAMIITGLILNTTFLVREIRRNEQQNAFLNAMTHELKTPIASIKLYLETLKSRELTKEKEREFYDVMLADSERLLATVEQVLEASKTRERSRTPKLEELDVGELVEGCSVQVLNRYDLAPDKLKIYQGAEAIRMMGDRAELQTVFVNLLDNAVKYSPGLVDIIVKIRRKKNGFIEVHIKDKGVGIPATDQKRVFKRFYRASDPETMSTKGTGLGLYIVRSIVETHGGRIFVKSRGKGKGTSFIVRLPGPA